jgi:hypothetical protein
LRRLALVWRWISLGKPIADRRPGGRDLQLTDDLLKLIEGDLCVDTKPKQRFGNSLRSSSEPKRDLE